MCLVCNGTARSEASCGCRGKHGRPHQLNIISCQSPLHLVPSSTTVLASNQYPNLIKLDLSTTNRQRLATNFSVMTPSSVLDLRARARAV